MASLSVEVPLQVELIVLRGSSKSPDVFVSERLFLKIGWEWGLAYNPGLGSWRRLPAGRCMLGGRCDGFVPSLDQPLQLTEPSPELLSLSPGLNQGKQASFDGWLALLVAPRVRRGGEEE